MARSKKRIRYAVVGLGHIAQAAVLPAFKHASQNSELAALVSSDQEKLTSLGEMYHVDRLYTYEQYEQCLQSGDVDAVYIALPNNMHCDYTVRAAQAGVHVLCEKPMAVTEEECRQMIDVCQEREVKLMIAYRLHFEEANLKAAEIAQSEKLGEIKSFHSLFSMQVADNNIRVDREHGGGTLFDIGIYCINAARYIFQDEPTEVLCRCANSGDNRFDEVEESAHAILRFPGDRIATFTSSFAAAGMSAYRVIGSKGDLRVEPAYDYAGKLKHHLTIDGKLTTKTFKERDQFAPELIYFSDCILNDTEPEPSGLEGMIDVHIIRSLYAAADSGKTVKLRHLGSDRPPTSKQIITRPPIQEPELVDVASPEEN